jgi:hypothetical protein
MHYTPVQHHSYRTHVDFPGIFQPTGCNALQVQNHASALPTDGSSAAVSISTYTYLQVQCPVAVTERASTADAAGEQGG